jgi:hypothetical protein
VLLFRPLAALPYESAAAVWLAIEIAGLVLSIAILVRLAGARLEPLFLGGTAATAVLWFPVFDELSTARVTLPILALAAGGQLASARRRPVAAGLLFGLALRIKPIVWLVLPDLLLRRAWRGALALTGVLVAGYAIAAAALGLDTLIGYVTRILPAVTSIYRATSRNRSLWSLGWRMFDGTHGSAPGIPIPASLEATALAWWPVAAPVAASLLALLVLGVTALLLYRERDDLGGLGIAIGASLLLSPTTWDFSLVLLALPLSTLLSRLAARRFPPGKTALVVGLIALTTIPNVILVDLATALGRLPTTDSGALVVAALPAILTMLAAIAVGGLAALLATGERTQPESGATILVRSIDTTNSWGTKRTPWERRLRDTASSSPWLSWPRRRSSPLSCLSSSRSARRCCA